MSTVKREDSRWRDRQNYRSEDGATSPVKGIETGNPYRSGKVDYDLPEDADSNNSLDTCTEKKTKE